MSGRSVNVQRDTDALKVTGDQYKWKSIINNAREHGT